MNKKGFKNVVLVLIIIAILMIGSYFVLRKITEGYSTYTECVEKTKLPCKHYFVGDFGQKWQSSPYRSKEECDNTERVGGFTCIIPPGNFREVRWINAVDLMRAEREKTGP